MFKGRREEKSLTSLIKKFIPQEMTYGWASITCGWISIANTRMREYSRENSMNKTRQLKICYFKVEVFYLFILPCSRQDLKYPTRIHKLQQGNVINDYIKEPLQVSLG